MGQGTLLLNEVDTLPLATNAALQEKIDAGEFRTVLCYRLKVVELALPPLRKAKTEIRPLVEYHTARLAREFDLPRPQIAPAVFPVLEAHHWPGNK